MVGKKTQTDARKKTGRHQSDESNDANATVPNEVPTRWIRFKQTV
jgi:hypothetical protein